MSKPKFTAGPWEVMPGRSAPRICVDGDPEWPIVVTVSGHSDEGIEANEHLIANATEMYQTLAYIEAHLRMGLIKNEAKIAEALEIVQKTMSLARGEK